ncbi:hypothetical protein D3C73_1664360 [compost metagenome]
METSLLGLCPMPRLQNLVQPCPNGVIEVANVGRTGKDVSFAPVGDEDHILLLPIEG